MDGTTAYVYDGEGQRVKKLLGESTRFVYGIGGQLIMEFDGSTGSLKKEYVYGGGMQATIDSTNGTQYTTTDIVGSPRVVTNSSGNVVSRHDYMPFGEELGSGTGGRTTGMGFNVSGDNNRKKFTGYQRDTESGLDFAEARYFASTQGRFNSPDPLSGHATDPQSWNRYSYVGNNPLTTTDPTGMSAYAPYASVGKGGEFYQGSINQNLGVYGNTDSNSFYDETWTDMQKRAGEAENAKINAYNAAVRAYNAAISGEAVAGQRPQNTTGTSQNQPLTRVTVLGNDIEISYSSRLARANRLIASEAIAAAAALLNDNASSLTAAEKKAIGQISFFEVAAPRSMLGRHDNGMTLSITYIKAVSVAWLASLFGHEGQHVLNTGKYSGSNLWRNEQSAGRVQLSIGNKIGFTAGESKFLEQWISDKNRAAMQKHMEGGLRY